MLATQTLGKVEAGRLQKAVEGYTSGAFTVRLTRNEEEALEGFITNGDGAEYSVAITPRRTFCSCKDSMFRHSTCKHAVVLALHVIRNPHPVQSCFALGDRVNLVGDPGWTGTVICVSGSAISVRWDRGGIRPLKGEDIELCESEAPALPRLMKTRKGFAFAA